MRATDLMIDDWVKFTSKYGNGTGQVVGIVPREGSAEPQTFNICKKKDKDSPFFVGVRQNAVKGIPITPEIIEKNGWKRVGKFFRLQSQNKFDEWCIEISINEDYVVIEADHHSDEILDFDLYSYKCHFVHELQHILRIINYNKEIEI